jgi:hypothetical protein
VSGPALVVALGIFFLAALVVPLWLQERRIRRQTCQWWQDVFDHYEREPVDNRSERRG